MAQAPEQHKKRVEGIVAVLREAGLPVGNPTLMGGPKWGWTWSLYQSEDHRLRLYVTFRGDDLVAQFDSSFMPVEHAPDDMTNPTMGGLCERWAWLVHQHRLTKDTAYLQEHLRAAGLPGAVSVAQEVQSYRTFHETNRKITQAFKDANTGRMKAALADLLRKTAAEVEAFGGILVVHAAEDMTEEGFVGCRVYISTVMGG